jgi:hypothetical protein
MALGDDLERIAQAAAGHGAVSAVLAAEPMAGSARAYLVALGEDEDREWIALDDESRPLERREQVREVASIVVMCELAGELAGGGDLEALRVQLNELRIVEHPEGIEQAEEAALALERAIGAPPRVASLSYLDDVGAATRALEAALGEVASPFASAVAASAGIVEAFVREVETRYRLTLR